jgi:hypothetical protein
MKLQEHLTAIGSPLLTQALASSDVEPEVRHLLWSILALHKVDQNAACNVCIDAGVRGATRGALFDALTQSCVEGSDDHRERMTALLRDAVSSARMKTSCHIHTPPHERAWQRDRDMTEKVEAAFTRKRDVTSAWIQNADGTQSIERVADTTKTRDPVRLHFRRGKRFVPVTFMSPSHLLSEYHNPTGILRGKHGFRQQHFVDALDRFLGNIRFWGDVYEEPSTVGWTHEIGRNAQGVMQYAR